MPIILRCKYCGKETPHVYPADKGWTVKAQIGGTNVFCPECQRKEAATTASDNEMLARSIEFLKRISAD